MSSLYAPSCGRIQFYDNNELIWNIYRIHRFVSNWLVSFRSFHSCKLQGEFSKILKPLQWYSSLLHVLFFMRILLWMLQSLSFWSHSVKSALFSLLKHKSIMEVSHWFLQHVFSFPTGISILDRYLENLIYRTFKTIAKVGREGFMPFSKEDSENWIRIIVIYSSTAS